MEAKDIYRQALNTNYLIIEEADLKIVIDNSEVIRIEDTQLSDFIRILKFEGKLFIQEKTFKNEIIIRKTVSLQTANSFIQERLDFYERKWDGCGCKIDYYE